MLINAELAFDSSKRHSQLGGVSGYTKAIIRGEFPLEEMKPRGFIRSKVVFAGVTMLFLHRHSIQDRLVSLRKLHMYFGPVVSERKRRIALSNNSFADT